jgi:hypothetical protein
MNVRQGVTILVLIGLAIASGARGVHGSIALPAATVLQLSTPSITVPCSTSALIADIHAANSAPGADTLKLAPGCAYVLTAVDNDTDGPNGLPVISTQIAIEGRGATIERSDTDGTPQFRILYVASAGDISIDELTIRNGDAGDTGAGGIYNDGGTVVLNDSTVADNHALNAGGIYNGGLLTLTDSTVSGNSATNNGGGMVHSGIGADLTGSTVSGNTANQGGGILNYNTLYLDDSFVSGNHADQDGGGILSYDTVTLDNSTVGDNSAGRDGGGIFNYQLVTLTGSTVSSNTAGNDGGGILNQAELELIDSTVNDNSASGVGGGIWSRYYLALTGSTVRDNQAGSSGGGIQNEGAATLIGSIISGNDSGNDGGGILCRNGETTLIDSTVSGNTSASTGGGISRLSDKPMRVENCTIVDNEAVGPGGGIFNEGHSPTDPLEVINSTIAGNRAVESGGLAVDVGPVTIVNSTLTGNTATAQGGGIGYFGGLDQVSLVNTILALNLAPVGPDCVVPVVSLGHNLIGDLTDCPIALQPSDLTGNPGLGAYTDTGMPGRGHYPLLSDSSAVDAGDDGVCPSTDQLGLPRPQDGDDNGTPVCDIGAVERQPVTALGFPVDIRPGGCPNPLSIHSRGVLPAAILGAEDLDVAQIDPASVRLEGQSPLRWSQEDVAEPYAPYLGKADANDCSEYGPDGVQDLVLKFNVQEIVTALGNVQNGDVRVLALSGQLKEEFGGTPIAGEDVVVIHSR